MEKEKLYFENIDATFCQRLDYFMEDAVAEGLEEITLMEALPDDDKNFIWCTYHGEVTERQMCTKAECPFYSSKSGRGVCEHRGKLFLHGEEVTFKIPKD